MLYYFIFVAGLQTHLSALMHQITIYINLLSIFDQAHLVTMIQSKKTRPKHQEIKLGVFIYTDVYMKR